QYGSLSGFGLRRRSLLGRNVAGEMKNRIQTCRHRICTPLLRLFATVAASALCADDWPQYRGPNHDGVSTEIIRTNWSDVAPREVWKVPLEPGLSSFSI